eukprot:CAMPEP_0114544874 /NCGR_PEP_ID=MMETSP0114-20121206/3103_1 /TAXON_ID=31324 /ORGANISM="Goniomonas sp, Strain m" /LENGTH=133 /DNA_ID=CAMNT_0001729271 /DNA_START=158 /DNA_END=559 /DNA_ORIENTATION=+
MPVWLFASVPFPNTTFPPPSPHLASSNLTFNIIVRLRSLLFVQKKVRPAPSVSFAFWWPGYHMQQLALVFTHPDLCILQAAALFTQAGDYQKTARFYYRKAEDTYYQANDWAAYDDWRRARDSWDYFYSRNRG